MSPHDDRTSDLPLSAYLVDSETSIHPLQTQSRAQHRIHAPAKHLRELTINALWYSDDARLQRRAEKIGMCSVAPTVYVGVGCNPTCSPGRCRDRLCPTCAFFRAGQLRTRLKKLVRAANAVRFITATMAPVSSGLGACVDALFAAFRLMRFMEEWKSHVVGGAYVVEVTRGQHGTHWHVHLHILVEGTFFPHDLLHALWSEAVGSRSRIEIKALHDRDGAVSYIAKYMAKSTALEGWTHDEIREFAVAMHGRRIVGTFGTWHKANVCKLDENAEKPKRAEADISFIAVEQVLADDEKLRRSVAPLLSRLSATWRLLMQPYRTDLEWVDAPLEGKELDRLTALLLEVRDALVFVPPDPEAIRREATRIAAKRRAAEKAYRPLTEPDPPKLDVTG